MVQLADIEPTHRVLEPSSGTGAILREIKKTGATVTAIEINRDLAEATGARCADFLECADLGRFDRAVMNPPFAPVGADIDHVQHAFAMLDESGVLIAVMSAGAKFRNDKKTTVFRALVDECGEIEDLPEDTFVDSGTHVPTVLVTLRK
jgi:methylase of polypeptide subunit release factors